jgi:indole-3-glycerol phosphate synthase
MGTILDEILEHKRSEVRAAKARVSADEMAERARDAGEAPRGFRAALAAADPPAVIAEIKRRSPSKGELRPQLDPAACARAYANGGAAAISVLTDSHYFGGRLDDLREVRSSVSIPVVRKDFVVDSYQIDEARSGGADAILLIAAALGPDELVRLREHAQRLGLDALVEVHDEEQLAVAVAAGVDLIGVNNRDLRTFEVDLAVTERLGRRLFPAAPAHVEAPDPHMAGPDRQTREVSGDGILLVAESGIFSHTDICRLQRAGARAFLVGESLMRQDDVALALRQLRRSS